MHVSNPTYGKVLFLVAFPFPFPRFRVFQLPSLNCASRHFVQMLVLNSQMCATSVTLSYFHVHTAINIMRCFGYPREHNFGLVLILSPTGCTEGCVYFPQSCRNTQLPNFLDCLLNTTLVPCLLVFFLSILHKRVCRVQSSVTGILRMGDMNIHMPWLTHVRTGPKKIASRMRIFI